MRPSARTAPAGCKRARTFCLFGSTWVTNGAASRNRAIATTRATRTASRLERRLAVRVALVVAIALFLLAAPLVTQVDPNKQNVLARLQPAGAVLADGRIALLGTDQLGRDMYARIL